MSTQIPLRIARSQAHPMRRQCLFQRPTGPPTRRCLAATAARAFSSTPARPYKKDNRLADARMQLAGAEATVSGNPAPTNRSDRRDAEEISEDIGLLQNTIIRAPFSRLPRPTSWEFYSYFWTLLKARFTALYTRSHFKRCVHKTGITSYLPVDFMKQKELKNKAKKMYKRYYDLLAAGDAKSLRKLCLPPLAGALRSQIAARGPVKMSWNLVKYKSARIVSHRCSPLGGDHPDTSYRQYVVRLESEQQLSMTPLGSARDVSKTRAPRWTPDQARKTKEVASVGAGDAEQKLEFTDNGKVQTVVEYLVMQTRVMEGKEEDWKVWGFASESTPAKIEEDEQYWKKMLDIQAAA
ncbi:uncharacterized protein EKO05_0004453 [Ascochyta rabiei]|uniref:Uncharacterized protein n=1 Tax=Didymella rabiei TaxID=5454 RepID=A0A163DNG2_DIDRA|nr:uncharacterized protein EKO05_0004453 [Ascochyta rabiei]KZM23272.1 hypothetical protein ST47_g5592 [Ascochyta rabiei]UPX13959.1 hypothetical protein EKO05_0004453 [Ascochyta rabiei]